MYKQFFNFIDVPFKKDISVDDFYMSSNLKETISRFEFLKQHRGFMLLTGESGSGKTAAIRYLFETINKSYFHTIYLQFSTVSTIEFYRQLNLALGGGYIHKKSDLFASIQHIILDLSINKKRIPIIVLDEAQFLKNKIFYEIQLLLNFNIDSIDPAIFIIVGQKYIYHILERPAYSPLFDRINIFFNIPFFSKSETIEYIKHRLIIAGCKKDIFNPNALDSIFNISNGNVRLINKLCFNAILFAAEHKSNVIDENIIFNISNNS